MGQDPGKITHFEGLDLQPICRGSDGVYEGKGRG